jgi:hypothetical protein
MTSPLASALASASDSGLRRRSGTVKSSSPLVVSTTDGDLPATSRLASYTPVVGHVVLVLVDDGGAAIVAGRLIAP